MSSNKPSLPSGTRDFAPEQVRRRRWIMDTIRGVFERYGYQPIETPAMENLSVLEGKYGEEGDRLLFRILNQGDTFDSSYQHLKSLFDSAYEEKQKSSDPRRYIDVVESEEDIEFVKDLDRHLKELNEGNETEKGSNYFINKMRALVLRTWRKGYLDSLSFFYDSLKNSKSKLLPNGIEFTERALRYDLTVPFARYVVMHQHELTLPFRRYQMQPVWRGDRPQRGRYREFWQCDADVVGSTSLIHEAEFIQIYDRALSALGLRDFTIRINHRQLLQGIAAKLGAADQLTQLTIALDKLDKVGREGVEKELGERGFTTEQIATLRPVFDITGEPQAVLDQLQAWLGGDENPGVRDLRAVLALAATTPLQHAKVVVDLTLARGLSYYTGCIFEVVTHEVQMGSIGGGGRYDNLTAAFGAKEALPGAGISFGVDRLYDVIEQLGRFPEAAAATTQVLVVNFSAELSAKAFERVTWLRDQGIAAEMYHEPTKKLGKQFEFADKRGMGWAWVEGPDDVAQGLVQLKNLASGTQEALAPEAALARLR
jgi:histidyl-tRNA synthetase